jgi:PIN domain nuclease of toxin-antitoxin system
MPHILATFRDPDNEPWLSPISTWEALVFHRKRKIYLSNDPDAWVIQARTGLLEAPMTHEIASRAANLSWAHRDPADRFLAATALVLGLTLVTADQEMLGFGQISTLANR